MNAFRNMVAATLKLAAAFILVVASGKAASSAIPAQVPPQIFFLAVDLAGFDALSPEEQVAAIQKDLSRVDIYLKIAKLQEARTLTGEIVQKIHGLKGRQSKEKGDAFLAKIDDLNVSIINKEDSLVKVNLEILKTQGSDAAFKYMQDVVWSHGVARDKIDMIESTIMDAGPAGADSPAAQADLSIPPELEPTREQPLPEPVAPPAIKPEPVANIYKSEPEPSAPATPALLQPAPRAPVQPVENVPQPAIKPVPAKTEKLAVPENQPPAKGPSTVPAEEVYKSPALAAREKSNQDYVRFQEKMRDSAHKRTTDFYVMIENKQGAAALAQFKKERAFLSKYIEKQAFYMLEQTIVNSALEDESAGTSAPTP